MVIVKGAGAGVMVKDICWKDGITHDGPEFLGETFTAWAQEAGMAIQYVQHGKTNQNVCITRFNRAYREKVVDQYLFTSLEHVREATWWWLIEYNQDRPHESLGDMTPLDTRESPGNSSYELST
ncbi:MAG: transposase [Halioglobus sp.]|nr:transposase [Halioglobus sp.]